MFYGIPELTKVRHGARIDQASDTWQDTATRVYDPPLTYGGWIQCQMLGARIHGELRNLDRKGSVNDFGEPPRKRRKVVIHSSPYLRCLQTSIAIGAGMREFHPPSRPSLPPTSAPTSAPLQRITSQEETSSNGAAEERKADKVTNGDHGLPSTPQRTKICLDGFLGEWLSPSYFDESSAPPASEELVKEAKRFFETPAEDIKGADLSIPAIPEFVGVDWSSRETETSATPIHEKTGLRAMAAAGHAISKRPRHSFAKEKTNGTLPRRGSWQIGYSPPIPTYSIAPRDAIPIGFVAHARDACIDFDANWDSMKPPLDWGDGGPFGEEWSSMHRRFRTGLQKMLAYYETSAAEANGASDEEDIVLVLVSHQAGCNAMIRLLTGAPALHDIGTASLTMAIRREQPSERRVSEQKSPSAPTRRGSLDLGIADDFEMRIVASTEHLRGGSNPLGLNSPRLGQSPALASKRAVGADSPEGFSIGDPMRSQSGHGALTRSLSQRSYAADDSPRIQSGLWRSESNSEAVEDNMTSPTEKEQLWGSGSERQLGASLPMRSASQRGMWGGETSIRRDRSPGKRRWTAVDRSP